MAETRSKKACKSFVFRSLKDICLSASENGQCQKIPKFLVFSIEVFQKNYVDDFSNLTSNEDYGDKTNLLYTKK